MWCRNEKPYISGLSAALELYIMFRGDDTTSNSQHQTCKVFLASDHWLSFDPYLFQGRIRAHSLEPHLYDVRANSDVCILVILDCVMNNSILSHGMVRFKRIQVTYAIQLPLHTAVTYCLEGRFWWHVTQTKLIGKRRHSTIESNPVPFVLVKQLSIMGDTTFDPREKWGCAKSQQSRDDITHLVHILSRYTFESEG